MESVKFEDLQLDDRILRAVADMGFEEASPIQAKSIPVQLEGVDMIGQAQTGTGKQQPLEFPFCRKLIRKTKAAGGSSVSHQRAGHPGGRGDPQSGKVYAWHQGPSDLRRTGYCTSD